MLGRDLRAQVRCLGALGRHEHEPHGADDDDGGDDGEDESVANLHRATCEPATAPLELVDEDEWEVVDAEAEDLPSF